MIYNLLFIFCIYLLYFFYFASYKTTYNDFRVRKHFVFGACTLLILQSGLRHVYAGEDTYAYSLMFAETSNTSWSELWTRFVDYYTIGFGKDPGYALFEKFFQIFSTNYQLYLLFIAFLFFLALGHFILSNTNYLVDVLFAFVNYSALFYVFYSLTGIRQTIAAAAALYSYHFLKKNKFVPFLLILLFAATIHKSCLVFIPFYFLAKIKNINLSFSMILLLFPVLFLQRENINFLLTVWNGYQEFDDVSGAGSYTFTILFVFLSFMGLIFQKSILSNSYNASHYFNAFSFVLILLPLSYINPSSLRIVMYFSIFMMLFIPKIILAFQRGNHSSHVKTTLILSLMLLLLHVKSNWSKENTYAFFWQHMELPKHYY